MQNESQKVDELHNALFVICTKLHKEALCVPA